IMFHVEHAPVDESAALARSSLDQAVNTWIDHIDCETARDLRDGSGGRAVDPVLDTVRPKLNAYTAMHIPVHIPVSVLHVHGKGLASMPGQAASLARSEGSGPTEQEKGLEQAGLARPVGAEEIVAGRV